MGTSYSLMQLDDYRHLFYIPQWGTYVPQW